MYETEHHQPEHTPVVNAEGRLPTRLRTSRHQYDAGPEEHRENRNELVVGERVTHEPNPEVHAFHEVGKRWVQKLQRRHRKRLDVDEENSEKGEASQNVEGKNTLGIADRTESGFHGLASEWIMSQAAKSRRRIPDGPARAQYFEIYAGEA